MHNTEDIDIVSIPKQITLANLGRSTKQEVFDWIVFNLLKQDRKSQGYDCDGDLMCMYRGDGGTKCAAGWLIDDSEFKDSFEFREWGDLVKESEVHRRNANLITALQAIHDEYDSDLWIVQFIKIAKSRKLNTKYLTWTYHNA